MASTGTPIPISTLVDASGVPRSGARVYSWVPSAAGAPTATPRTLYTSPDAETTPAANPYVLGTSGHGTLYKKAAEGVVIQIKGAEGASDEGTTYLTVHYPAIGDAILVIATGSDESRTLADRFRDWINVKDYDGWDGSTSEIAFVAAAADALAEDAGTGVVFVPRGTVYAIDNNPSPVANVGFFQISPRYQGDTAPSWQSDGTLYGDADEPSNVWIALEGRFDRGSTTEDDTQAGLFVGVHGDTSDSDVSYIKMAAYFRYRLNDPSDYVASPDINRDGVAMGAFAVIAAGNTLGRAWAGYFDIRVEATGDGVANGVEVDCFNAGTTQTALNQTTSKYGVIVYASSGHFTAAFYANYDSTSGSNEFEYAYAANPSAIASGGYFLFLDDLFGVKNDGQTVIGSDTPRSGYTLTLNSAASTKLGIVSDGANESVIAFVDTGTAAWAAGIHNTSAEFRIANGEALGSSVALAISNTTLDAAFSGHVNVASSKVYKVNGTQVVGAQGAAVADALTGGSATAADCATQLNLVISRLEAHGLIAP